MRTTTEIRETALRVERDLPVGGVDQLDLVPLRLCLEPREGLVAADLLAGPGAALGELAPDLVLDRLEVRLVDRLGELEVVVEAVLDRRADRDLHTRMQPTHGLGEQVRCRVAQHRERVRILAVSRRQDLQASAVRQRQPKVARLTVDAREHRLLREPRPDRAGSVERARSVGKFELRAVGEDHVHGRARIVARPSGLARDQRPGGVPSRAS